MIKLITMSAKYNICVICCSITILLKLLSFHFSMCSNYKIVYSDSKVNFHDPLPILYFKVTKLHSGILRDHIVFDIETM